MAKSIEGNSNMFNVNMRQMLEKAIIEKLNQLGEFAIKYAIENHEFENRTYNLEDSYSFAVYKNGNMIGSPVMYDKKATEKVSQKGVDYGHDEAKNFLNSQNPQGDYALVVCAALFYGDILEEIYSLDVLSATEWETEKEAKKILNNLNWVKKS